MALFLSSLFFFQSILCIFQYFTTGIKGFSTQVQPFTRLLAPRHLGLLSGSVHGHASEISRRASVTRTAGHSLHLEFKELVSESDELMPLDACYVALLRVRICKRVVVAGCEVTISDRWFFDDRGTARLFRMSVFGVLLV